MHLGAEEAGHKKSKSVIVLNDESDLHRFFHFKCHCKIMFIVNIIIAIFCFKSTVVVNFLIFIGCFLFTLPKCLIPATRRCPSLNQISRYQV